MSRTRWAAVGAAVAVTLGAGTLSIVDADDTDRTSYTPITPCRLADNRPASQVGEYDTRIGSQETRTFSGRGSVGACELPSDAVALSVNVIAVDATADSYYTAWPTGENRPVASQLNPSTILTATSNSFDVALSSDGTFDLYNNLGTSDTVIDVLGVYTGLGITNGQDGADGADGADGQDAPELAAYFADTDDDGFGDPATFVFDYSQPDGFVTNSTDCDDTDAAVNPAVSEDVAFDRVDADCDGEGLGVVTRISVATDTTQGDGASSNPTISADGRYITFASGATNLVTGDTNSRDDIFVHDTTTATTTRISVATDTTQGDGASSNPTISADGRYITFASGATNLVTGDTNSRDDIFVHDTTTATTTRISVATDTTQGDGASSNPTISADGRYITFASGATNLVTGDTNSRDDIFVHDTTTATTTRISVATDTTQGDGASSNPTISADGRYITFASGATNLVTGDTNSRDDIFVHDTTTATTTRISVATDTTQGDGASSNPTISADGRYITFASGATNLVTGDTNSRDDIFVHDTTTATTTRISVATDTTQGDGASSNPTISADGRYITFASGATNLVTGDTNSGDDIFVHDTTTATTTRISVATDTTQGDGTSSDPTISADGRYITFASGATNLVTGDTNSRDDIFVQAG